MCRSIKPLFHFDPPVTDQEIQAAALQFVRKVSGFTKPSQINQPAFDQAVEAISRDTKNLLESLVTNSPVRHRLAEAPSK